MGSIFTDSKGKRYNKVKINRIPKLHDLVLVTQYVRKEGDEMNKALTTRYLARVENVGAKNIEDKIQIKAAEPGSTSTRVFTVAEKDGKIKIEGSFRTNPNEIKYFLEPVKEEAEPKPEPSRESPDASEVPMPPAEWMSWPLAVKIWNANQPFNDELYVLPKKGSDSYEEVKEVRGEKPSEKKKSKEEENDKEYAVNQKLIFEESDEVNKYDIKSDVFTRLVKAAREYKDGNYAVRIADITTDAGTAPANMSWLESTRTKTFSPTKLSTTKAPKTITKIHVYREQHANQNTTITKGEFLKLGYTLKDWKEVLTHAKGDTIELPMTYGTSEGTSFLPEDFEGNFLTAVSKNPKKKSIP